MVDKNYSYRISRGPEFINMDDKPQSLLLHLHSFTLPIVNFSFLPFPKKQGIVIFFTFGKISESSSFPLSL